LKKPGSLFTRLLIVIVLVVVIGAVHNRISFGIWNPLDPPERFNYNDRTYYRSSQPSSHLPIHPAANSPKWYYGFVYSDSAKSGQPVPTVLCLRMRDSNRYLIYELSGGP